MRPRKVILLADDIESSMGITKFMLETRGHFQVLTARNIHGLFEVLRTIRVDLVMIAFADQDCNALSADIKAHWPDTRVVIHGGALQRYDTSSCVADLIMQESAPIEIIEIAKKQTARRRGPRKAAA